MPVCRQCGFESPGGFAFCGRCGQALAAHCGRCGAELTPGFAFCGRCGAPVGPEAAPPPQLNAADLEQLREYLPTELYEELRFDAATPAPRLLEQSQQRLAHLMALSASHLPQYLVERIARNPQPGQVGGQFLPGTLLFADISGFTAMSERLSRIGREGAEEITSLVNRYFDVMLHLIREYDGQLIKFGGDALLALFPEPADADRAASAGLHMQMAMAEFVETRTSQGTFPLQMKIGLKRGQFFAAELGTARAMEYALFGADVNAVAATESAASAGQVLMDTATRQALTLPVRVSAGPPGYVCLTGLEAEWTGPRRAAPAVWPAYPDAPVEHLRQQAQLLSALTPYLPAGLLPRLRSGRQQAEGEHRLVAILFANVLGLGALVEALGPGREAEITAGLNRYFTAMSEVAQRYGGVVNKIDLYDHGDKLLAFFGAPVMHEDDAERAIRAAWAMREALAAANRAQPAGQPFRQKLGISYGCAFAGYMGTTWRHEYTVMGDEVNLAARLMSAAPEDSITTSGHAMRRMRSVFVFAPRGQVSLKGKSQPFQIYTLEGPGTTPASAEPEGPLVGRVAEMQRATLAVEKFLAGRGQVLAVVGEAGLGKSRLAAEVRLAAERRAAGGCGAVRWATARCLSYTESASYQPFQALARQLLNAEAAPTPLDAAARVAEAAAGLFAAADQPSLTPYLLNFLSLPLDAAQAERVRHLDTEALQRRTFWALGRLVEASAQRPGERLVLAFGDIHWMDAASLALLNYLLPATDRAPLLFVLTYRPERAKGSWAVHERLQRDFAHSATLLQLGPLPEAETRQRLDYFVPAAQRPPELDALILRRAEGNPFYIEELVRMVMDKGLLKEAEDGRWQLSGDLNAALPDTLQGVLVSRLDALDEAPRQVAHVAAVIGRAFPHQVLAETEPGSPAALNTSLARLQQSEIVAEQLATELTYHFRNTLMQEVCYETLLARTRRQYHRRVAEVLEARHLANPADAEALAPLIAYHAFTGRDWPRALKYQLEAGQQAQRLFANTAALEHFDRALQCTEQLSPEETAAARLTARLALGELYTVTGQYELAAAHLQAALALAQQAPEAQARAYHGLGRGCELRGDYPAALTWLERGLAVLDGRETPAAAELRITAGLIHNRQSHYDLALEQSREALRLASATGELAVVARANNLLGVLELRRNGPNALPYFQQAFELYQRVGHLGGQATAENLIAVYHAERGHLAEAEGHYRQARTAFEQMGDLYNRAITDNNLGEVSLKRGALDEAVRHYAAALQTMAQIGGSPWALGNLNLNLGGVFLRRRDAPTAREHFKIAGAYFEQAQVREFLPELHRRLGEAALLEQAWAAAEAEGQTALTLAQEFTNRNEEGYSRRLLGEAALARAQLDQAETSLLASADTFGAVSDDYGLARTRLALAQLRAAQGRLAEARRLAQAARQVFAQAEAALDAAETDAWLESLPVES